jgi:acetate kinase
LLFTISSEPFAKQPTRETKKMNDSIFVLNSGSSSIKFSLFDQVEEEELRLVFSGQVDGIGVMPKFKAKDAAGTVLAEEQWDDHPGLDHQQHIGRIISFIRQQRSKLGLELAGVGHRVVHGGARYSQPVRITTEILKDLELFIPLAPLHQGHNINTIRAVQKLGPEIPQVACFDTAFHRTIPEVAQRYAIPRSLTEEGVRRYGFHGLSYEYIARCLRRQEPELAKGRVVVAHLGSGASMCALQGGRSIASSMGFSAMDGLVMGTRPGSIDPGVVLYLLEEKRMAYDDIVDLLYKNSGLLGVSGISNDMRELEKSQAPEAKEAIELFLYRIRRELGSMVAVLGGLDGLVFTAGIGENSTLIRRRVGEQAGWLGVKIDHWANDKGEPIISTFDSKVAVWTIPTNEELMIATHTRNLLLGR